MRLTEENKYLKTLVHDLKLSITARTADGFGQVFAKPVQKNIANDSW